MQQAIHRQTRRHDRDRRKRTSTGRDTVMKLEKQRVNERGRWTRTCLTGLIGFALSAALQAQTLPVKSSPILPFAPSVSNLLAQTSRQPIPDQKNAVENVGYLASVATSTPYSGATAHQAGPRRITLAQAQQQAQAAGAANPMAHIAALGVEAAKQHREGAESDYFPKISSTLTNFHFNKFMGQEVTIQRPFQGGTLTAGLPLAGKDQTLIALTAAQPLTPLFKLHEVVNIARADERLAMAKAGMPVETAANVEKDYYALLVAQRQLVVAKANAQAIRNKTLLASTAATLAPEQPEQEIAAAKQLVFADSKVKELTVSLDELLGYSSDTELELVPPDTQIEDISLKEVADKAMVANPEIVEAESNVAKAHAASRLSKLDYVPDVLLMGGYAYNDNSIPLLPRDFSFIGIMGSYTLFDFGKREHTIKERTATLSQAEAALELTKAKVAAAVKASYFDMDRSRQLTQLAHRISAEVSVKPISSTTDDPDRASAQAKVDIEILQADLEYRQALARLKTLMGEK
jgi:outer membrane protein TolC